MLDISTHTLTWSVTYIFNAVSNLIKYFNSHAHVERDVETNDSEVNDNEFQLTRSRGA